MIRILLADFSEPQDLAELRQFAKQTCEEGNTAITSRDHGPTPIHMYVYRYIYIYRYMYIHRDIWGEIRSRDISPK